MNNCRSGSFAASGEKPRGTAAGRVRREPDRAQTVPSHREECDVKRVLPPPSPPTTERVSLGSSTAVASGYLPAR